MGGNVGDAIAPIVVGAVLAVLSWREVVILNVVPGIVIALLLFVFLGTLQLGGKKREASRDPARSPCATISAACPGCSATGGSFAFDELRVPLHDAERTAHFPSGVSRVRNGLFALLGGRLHVRAADRGFAAAPVAGHLSDRMGRKSVMMTSMADDRRGARLHGARCKSLAFVFFVAVLGFFLYAIRPVLQAWLLERRPGT